MVTRSMNIDYRDMFTFFNLRFLSKLLKKYADTRRYGVRLIICWMTNLITLLWSQFIEPLWRLEIMKQSFKFLIPVKLCLSKILFYNFIIKFLQGELYSEHIDRTFKLPRHEKMFCKQRIFFRLYPYETDIFSNLSFSCQFLYPT